MAIRLRAYMSIKHDQLPLPTQTHHIFCSLLLIITFQARTIKNRLSVGFKSVMVSLFDLYSSRKNALIHHDSSCVNMNLLTLPSKVMGLKVDSFSPTNVQFGARP